jgi:RHS repeat-associated protein
MDKLGRVIETETFNGATPPVPWGTNATSTGKVTVLYSGKEVRVTDQDGKVKASFSDALGRIVQVKEANQFDTFYTYDALDNLTKVNQAGRERTFEYDSLSRLTKATNLEGSPIEYVYNRNGGLTQKTQKRKIAAPEVIIMASYSYDAHDRLTQVSYNDSTPAVTYTYDDPAVTFSKGRLTKVENSVSRSEVLGYDAFGRVLKSRQTTDGVPYLFGTNLENGYEYTQSDGLKTLRYPSGRVVSMGFHNNGWLKNVSGSVNGQLKNYIHSSGIVYHPHGAEKLIPMGNGVEETRNYNGRLQPVGVRAEKTDTGLLLGIVNDFGSGASIAANNGNVRTQKIEPGAAAAITQSFGYDGLNRLLSFSESGTVGETYGYDQWGNRWVSAITGLQSQPNSPQSAVAFDVRNRLTTANAAFDDAGNQILDAPYTLSYDAENRLKSATSPVNNNASYFYDGNGRRVKTVVNGTATIFVYDAFGNLVAEYGGTATGGISTNYLTQDHLGSTRLMTNDAGGDVKRYDYRPFGGLLVFPQDGGGCAAGTARAGIAGYCLEEPRMMFTGQQRDGETGLDYFLARYMSSAQGRFTSPDAPFADQVVGDPQSWNLYSYVRNNPMSFVDPNGRACRVGGDGKDYDDPNPGQSCTEVREADSNKKADLIVKASTSPDNVEFALLYLRGSFPAGTNIEYGDQDKATLEMKKSKSVLRARRDYVNKGCPAEASFASDHGEAYLESLSNAYTGRWNSTQFQVGGFVGSMSKNSAGNVQFQIRNTAGFSSLSGFSTVAPWISGKRIAGNSLDNPFGKAGLMHNVKQTFSWVEMDPCAYIE